MKRAQARQSYFTEIAALTFAVGMFACIGSACAQSVPPRIEGRSFTTYTPLATTAELTRRSLTPLDSAALHLPEGEQSINLANERFVVRIPARRPAQGYGVLVFVPPWDEDRIPKGWGPVLDRFGLIFVAAPRSGNEQSTLGRREPLAILAAHNIATLYPVNSQQIFVGGFSGGSRVAIRLALAYPDLFRGALLEAGSDAIGTHDLPLPPRDLFDRFRRQSRLSYVTGTLDSGASQLDGESLTSMSRWCVSNVDARQVPGLGHDLINGSALSTALAALMRPANPAQWANACWSRAIADVDSKLDRAASLIRSGDRKAALEQLVKTDRQYGGLAAPRIRDLARQAQALP